MICHPCKYQLEKSYQFRKKCQVADAKLKKHIKLIEQLEQDQESDSQESRENSKDSTTGKSKQVKQLLANLVTVKGNSSQVEGESLEMTEEELVGGYILGIFSTTICI